MIVEEAAKATGPELAGALALGSRRLMIGDHRQLPPFDAERLGKVFANASIVEKLLGNAQGAVGALFDEAVLEQLAKLLGNEIGDPMSPHGGPVSEQFLDHHMPLND